MQTCLVTLYVAMNQGMYQILLRPIQQLVLVEALQSRTYAFFSLWCPFREEKFLMSINFVRVNVVHSPHSCNRYAHNIARIGLNCDLDRLHDLD